MRGWHEAVPSLAGLNRQLLLMKKQHIVHDGCSSCCCRYPPPPSIIRKNGPTRTLAKRGSSISTSSRGHNSRSVGMSHLGIDLLLLVKKAFRRKDSMRFKFSSTCDARWVTPWFYSGTNSYLSFTSSQLANILWFFHVLPCIALSRNSY